MVAPYAFIINPLEVIREVLRDPDLNHHLNEVIPFTDQNTAGGTKLTKDKSVDFLELSQEEQLPHIQITIGNITPIGFGQPKFKGFLTDEFLITIRIDIDARRDGNMEYEGILYQGSDQVLYGIMSILTTTFGHAVPFKKSYKRGIRSGFITFSDIRGIGAGIVPGDSSVPSAIDKLVLTYQFGMELSYPYTPGILRDK